MTLLLSPRTLGRGIGSSARKIPGSVVLSVVVLVAVAICVIVPSVLVPGALDQNLALGVSPAGTPGHLLGTDKVGRDVLALTVAGARDHRADRDRRGLDGCRTHFRNERGVARWAVGCLRVSLV